MGRHDAIALDEQNILLKKEESPKEEIKEDIKETSPVEEETQEALKNEVEIGEEDIWVW